MKISAFANMFDVNVSTVRHYINSGLLVPDVKNGQYFFDQECEDDMKNIIKYKNYRFSLEEIQLLFFMEKASRFQDELVLEVCTEILKHKKDELIKEKKELTKNINSLEEDIAKMPDVITVGDVKWGVPFAMIPNLYCPKCQIPLELDSAKLSNNYLFAGEIKCTCGYSARIEDGVIVSGEKREDTPFKAFENIESVVSLKEEYSHQYRSYIAKAYLYMRDQIHNDDGTARVVLAGPFTFNFLLEYIDKLGTHNSFIIMDPSIARINKLKRLLSDTEYDILYFAGDSKDLPIKQGSIDVYIDDWSTVNMLFTFDEYNTSLIAPLLKNKAIITGLYADYTQSPKGISNFIEDNPSFTPKKMTFSRLEFDWNQNGVKIKDKKSIGQTNKTEKHFPRAVVGESIEVFGYTAKKE